MKIDDNTILFGGIFLFVDPAVTKPDIYVLSHSEDENGDLKPEYAKITNVAKDGSDEPMATPTD